MDCKDEKRNYDNVDEAVKESYKLARINQTYQFVNSMHEKYSNIDRCETIWNILEKLNSFTDISDPDCSFPNTLHALQTAEMMRKDDLPDWLQLVGLIHDMGKVMYVKGDNETGTGLEKQWAIVGDTFIIGCKIPDKIVFPEFNQLNKDSNKPTMNTELGIYKENCGLDNVICSWGHDEYLYRLLIHEKNQNTLPEEALYIIRFHSLYSYHTYGEYQQFVSQRDKDMFKWLKLFNKYDLYSKNDIKIDPEQCKQYYINLIKKYFKFAQFFY